MPIAPSAYRALPKLGSKETRRVGKKVDWSKVPGLMKDRGGFSVKEVWEIVKADCMIAAGTTISRVRVKKYLDKQVEKNLATVRDDEGAFRYELITAKTRKRDAKASTPSA